MKESRSELAKLYDWLGARGQKAIESNDLKTDSYLDSLDNRRGLTVIARPSKLTLDHIERPLRILNSLEPDQYYYPVAQIHFTILSIVTGRPNFRLQSQYINELASYLAIALEGQSKLQINWSGLLLTDNSVILKGYPAHSQLLNMRNRIRSKVKESGLAHTMDQRYVLSSAHMTLVRFRSQLSHPVLFCNRVESLAHSIQLGQTISQVKLVYGDWYMQPHLVDEISSYDLK